jgi:phosphate:Na+ symporter
MFMTIALGLIGGLGLFLFGMNMMASGMQKAAGDRLRRILEVLTSNPYMATLTGIAVTMMVQSSSTTSVMVVGFTNSGLMGLSQALGTMLGASIGTTITAQLISFDFSLLIYPLIGIGVSLHLFVKRRLSKSIGQGLLGFAILFLGLEIMSETMHPLRDFPPFLNMMTSIASTPILGVLVGTLFTAIIQSSSATSGVVIALTIQGTIGGPEAIALLLGANIGTTITAALASIGTNLTARRSVLAIFLVKVTGTVVALMLFKPFLALVALTANSVTREVANAHTLFNIINVIVFIPFLKPTLKIVEKLMPGDVESLADGPKHLNKRILATPTAAIEAAKQETLHMAQVARELLGDAISIFKSEDHSQIEKSLKKEDLIDQLEKDIVTFLNEIAQNSLSKDQSEVIFALMHICSDIERIGDHSVNIIRMAEIKLEESLVFSVEGIEELDAYYEKVDCMLADAIRAFSEDDIPLAKDVITKDNIVDNEERQLRKNHIQRLNQRICKPHAGIMFLDIISNLERIADHATNLAEVVTGDF